MAFFAVRPNMPDRNDGRFQQALARKSGAELWRLSSLQNGSQNRCRELLPR